MSVTHPVRPLGAVRAVAACSALLGPSGAWLYESGSIDVFGSAYGLNLWLTVAGAVFGGVVGVYTIVRGVLLFGIASLVLNSAVAALYGFLALFFGLGGSR